MKLLLITLLAGAAGAAFADSEAMQRERALNRILVAERHERERELAARGSGLVGIHPARPAAKPATKSTAKPEGGPAGNKPRTSPRQPKKR